MGVTRLERKGRKNVAVAKRRKSVIKHLSGKPVIKNIDIEAIKAEFAAKKSKTTAKPKAKTEKVEEVQAVEVQVEKSTGGTGAKVKERKPESKVTEEKKPKTETDTNIEKKPDAKSKTPTAKKKEDKKK